MVLEVETHHINTTKDMASHLLPLEVLRIMDIQQEDIVLNAERRDKTPKQNFVHHVVNHITNNCADCT